MAARQRKGWTRLQGGCGGVWKHDSGWLVRHCGHPTALWPYYGLRPEGGQMLLSGGFGVGIGFRTLALAQAAVEEQIAKAKEDPGDGESE
jgi:hypothetical protein